MRIKATLGVGLATLLFATAALAEKPASLAAADALFREAVELANEGRFEDAAAKFRASFDIDPTLGTLLGLAMAEERSNKTGSAYVHYRELADRARALGDTTRLEQAEKRIAALEPAVARLVLVKGSGLPTSARIELDGTRLPIEAAATPIPIDDGEHVVRVVTDDGVFSQTLSVRQGERTEVTLRAPPAQPAPAPAPPPAVAPARPTPHGWRTAGIVSAGVGAASLAASGLLWLAADHAYSDASRTCPGPSCDAGAHDTIARGRALETWSRVALVAGLAGAAAGTTFILIDARGRELRTTVGPASVALGGTF